MPIEVTWGNPQQSVTYVVFSENWTLEDIHTMIDDMYKLTTSVDHTVHSILDFTDSKTSPAQLMSAGRHVVNRTVPNTGISVIVKANGFLKTMSQMITKMFMKEVKLYFADSAEEAYQIIEQREQVVIKS